MAFDAGMVAAITDELQRTAVGGRIEKVHQPEKDELLLLLHTEGGNLRLTVSASANNPRIHLSTEVKENPSAPPTFCILARKHLTGGRITEIVQTVLFVARTVPFASMISPLAALISRSLS